jgi:hypothetical protein
VSLNVSPEKGSENKYSVTSVNDTIEKVHKPGNPKCKFGFFKSVEVMTTPNTNFQRYKAGCSVMMFYYLTRK